MERGHKLHSLFLVSASCLKIFDFSIIFNNLMVFKSNNWIMNKVFWKKPIGVTSFFWGRKWKSIHEDDHNQRKKFISLYLHYFSLRFLVFNIKIENLLQLLCFKNTTISSQYLSKKVLPEARKTLSKRTHFLLFLLHKCRAESVTIFFFFMAHYPFNNLVTKSGEAFFVTPMTRAKQGGGDGDSGHI